jgi:ferredoxin
MTGTAALEQALAAHGLVLGGGFAPEAADGVPLLPGGRAARWLALAGVAGSSLWPHFQASAAFTDGRPDPLDRWSREIGDAIAARFGGVALFPFGGAPQHPFPRWAERAGKLTRSPLGLQLHPRYGLWHSYRFALALPQPLEGHEDTPDPADLCLRCAGQPCLRACPVDAFTGREYRVDACAAHLESEPQAACRSGGCLARHACPVGQDYAQDPAHARFLMDAFVRAVRRRRA